MTKSLVFFAVFFLASGGAYAGSGFMDGERIFEVAGKTRSLTCNCHIIDPLQGTEKFFCEYTNRMADGQPNESMFIGDIYSRPRGNLFVMTQFDGKAKYVSVSVGHVNRGGTVTGVATDVAKNNMPFTIR